MFKKSNLTILMNNCQFGCLALELTTYFEGIPNKRDQSWVSSTEYKEH